MNAEQPVKTILILAANPKGTVPLRLDEEVREIKAGLQRSRHRERFVVEYESAARPRDVRRAMLDYKPQVVHFCGHGGGEHGLVLEDETGNPKLVSTEAIANLFELFSDQVECVLLNACYSEVQAQAIAQHIPAVIGMNQAIAGIPLSIATDQSKADLTAISQPLSPIPQPLPAAQPVSLELPEGTMDLESHLYVARSGDAIALDTIKRQGVTITIKGPRQMGKSSLLIRTMAAAVEAGKRVAFLDFQLFDKTALTDGDRFFQQFCAWLTDELELADRVEEFWNLPLGNSQRCTRYMQRYLLKEIGSPLVLAMDEVESVFDTDFRSDFFSMLRSWHNNRASIPIWKQLDLVLVTSTEPYQLIENLNQSPFNVGQVIELTDFPAEQVTDLNQRHGSPLNPSQTQQLMALLGGHPYLTRRALYLVASGQLAVAELFAEAAADRGPFGDHLRYHLFRMNDKKDLIQGLLQVIRNQTCPDERIFFRLRGVGLVQRGGRSPVVSGMPQAIDHRQTVLPRCQLYAEYFQEHLRG